MRNSWKQMLLLVAIACLSGCASKGRLHVTGYGAPGINTEPKDKRLEALQNAEYNAWTLLYDEVRAMPYRQDVLVGDQLSVDSRAKARVINYIWNAKVHDQAYDAEKELAYIKISIDPKAVAPLIRDER